MPVHVLNASIVRIALSSAGDGSVIPSETPAYFFAGAAGLSATGAAPVFFSGQ
jgi:hypothetical protein